MIFLLLLVFSLDNNEVEIVRLGVEPIISGAELAADQLLGGFHGRSDKELTQLEELATQCCRAMRNLSVNPENKSRMLMLGAIHPLQSLATYHSERISPQAKRALKNLQPVGK
jgi:hypothetical protein